MKVNETAYSGGTQEHITVLNVLSNYASLTALDNSLADGHLDLQPCDDDVRSVLWVCLLCGNFERAGES